LSHRLFYGHQYQIDILGKGDVCTSPSRGSVVVIPAVRFTIVAGTMITSDMAKIQHGFRSCRGFVWLL
jgi:hypothetical protein